MIQHSDWLWQGRADEAPDQPAGRAIIGINDNHGRWWPEITNDNPYLWCPIDDNGDHLTHDKLCAYEEFARRFKERGIYVHCAMGANRSSWLCVYLLYMIDNVPIEVACEIVGRNNPNKHIYTTLAANFKKLTGIEVPCP